MPKGDEYHQPNAPDAYQDDHDSDIELELQELAPAEPSRINGNANGQERDDDDSLPLRNLRSSRLGRRAKRNGPAGDIELEDRGEGDGDQSTPSDGLNEGDQAPLLPNGDESKRSLVPPRSLAERIGLRGRRGRSEPGQSSQSQTTEGEEAGKHAVPRTFGIGQWPPPRFPSNAISNAKYTPWSFLPRTLYQEFSFFINLYFLVVALSQLIPDLLIGVLWTYIAPLAFVLSITLGKEAYDDLERRKRDAEANREPYTILSLREPSALAQANGKPGRGSKRRDDSEHRLNAASEEEENLGGFEIDETTVKAKDIKVGDVLKLNKNDRVPADVLILKSIPQESASRKSFAASVNQDEGPALLDEEDSSTKATTSDQGAAGEAFIRTDQLDGETDWKLRIASPLTQNLHPSEFPRLTVVASKPSRNVHEFLGRFELAPKPSTSTSDGHDGASASTPVSAPLSIDNTAWANTILASSATILAVVVYTGPQTRAALSTAPSRSKVGLLEYEMNNLTKILCAVTLVLSGLLVLFQWYYKSLETAWYISVCRFLILFSSIIPISLRVNLDLGKTAYAYFIQHDKDIPEAVVRTSTIPEDLGRIEYLLSDKTGTLTQNGKIS
jgi:phospholipid-translocating ATPase